MDIKRKYLTPADMTFHLRYLLAKADDDDIITAVRLVHEHLQNKFPERLFKQNGCVIIHEMISPGNFTVIHIKIFENKLYLTCNLYSVNLEVEKEEPDMKLVEDITKEILTLGFYKIGEENKELDEMKWHEDIFRLDISPRK